MRLESIHGAMSAEFRKVETSKKEEKSTKGAAYTRKADKASLSSDARQVSDTKASANVVAARIDAEPDIRTEKVDEVRKKLEDGYYNSSKFADELAEKLIKDFGF